MTGFADCAAADVVGRHAVTAGAGTQHLVVINPEYRRPLAGVVTRLAQCSGADVYSWLGMTTCAGSQYLGMINSQYRYPYIAAVAGLADIGALYVCE